MVLATIFFGWNNAISNRLLMLPLAIGAVCIVTSIIGTFFVSLGKSQDIMGALYKGLIATGVLSIVAIAGVINYHAWSRLRQRTSQYVVGPARPSTSPA